MDDSAWSRLGQMLADAVVRQRQIAARSPHVLRFIGNPGELPDGTLYVEHEPASAMSIAGLFHRDAPLMHAAQLLRVTVALFDALRVAHALPEPRAAAHGGVCPGVVLYAADGTVKLTDFGFAAAICDIAGTQAYVNLAVGPAEPTEPGTRVTGAWEVLPAHQFNRDDRICAFIDPEKYGTQTLSAFEPGSDVIAAGFIIHLLAEHQHPYLYADPDAHRLVEMSEFMAMGRYNGARRKDLRESGDAGVKLWCELIAGTLARLPQSRPTAAAVAEALAEHVTAEDASDHLRRKLDALEELLRAADPNRDPKGAVEAWGRVQDAAQAVAAEEGAPPDVIERANSMMLRAQASLLIAQANEAFGGEDWPTAATPIAEVLAMPGLPADLVDRAREISQALEANLAARQVISRVETSLEQTGAGDPVALVDSLEASLAELDRVAADRPLLPPLRFLLAAVRNTASSRLDQARPQAEAATEADRAKAADWLGHLTSDLKEGQWDDLEDLLARRPPLRSWPREVADRAGAIQRQLDEHRLEQKRRAAVEADRKAAAAWIAELRRAVEGQRWNSAEQVLSAKPRLTHWPDEVLREANRLAALVRAAARREEDERQARQWAQDLKQAVEADNWDAGADLLAQRPALDRWPDDLLQDIAPYQRQVEQRVEAIDLERRRAEQESRQAQAWLDQAGQSANERRWEEALAILDEPPPLERMPEDVLGAANGLRATCRANLGEELAARLRARTEAVLALARHFVRQVAAKALGDLLHPDGLDVRIDAEEFVSEHPGADGRALLRLGLRRPSAQAGAGEPVLAFDFRADQEPRAILDDDGRLRARIAEELTTLVGRCQQSSVVYFQDALREGLFPRAEVTVELTEPAIRVAATMAVLGPEDAAGTLKTEIVWDPARLVWAYADLPGFAKRALDVAVGSIAAQLDRQLLEGDDRLRPYRSLVSLKLAIPGRPDLRGPLALEAQLTIPPGRPITPQTLQTLRGTCAQVGRVECDTNLTPAVTKLRQLIVDAQNADRQAIESNLLTRIKAAGAKVKVEASPSSITEPVEQVTFSLTAKGRKPLEFAAAWDTTRIGFALPEAWQKTVNDFFGGKAAGRKPAEAPTPPGGGQVVAKPAVGRRRRAIGLVATAAVVGVVAGTWLVWPQGERQPPLPTSVETKPGGEQEPRTMPEGALGDAQASDDNVTAARPGQSDLGEGRPGSGGQAAEMTAAAGEPPADDASEQPAADAEAEPTAGDADAAERGAQLAAAKEFRALDERFTALAKQLEHPSHEELRALIEGGAVPALDDDLADFAANLPTAADDLTARVAEQRRQVAQWQQNLTVYAAVFDTAGKSVPEQIEALEAAKDVWATDYVAGRLAALPQIAESLARADDSLQRDAWRAARFFLQQAADRAAAAGLVEQVAGPIDAANRQLADKRHNQLAPLLETAREWLDTHPLAPDALSRLADTDYATEARNRLDQLDLDYPVGAGPGTWFQKAAEESLFPWTVLTDDERAAVEGLLARVVVPLEVQADDGTVAATIGLVFVPAVSAAAALDPVWLTQTEITVEQYRAVMGELPQQGRPVESYNAMRSKLSHPVAFVAADGVPAFLDRLSERFHRRLIARTPTEAEWKFALSAGGFKPLEGNPRLCKYTDDGQPQLDPTRMNFESDEKWAIMAPGHLDGYGTYAPVRSYPPNQWGLYEMLGNVSEWVSAARGLQSMGGSYLDSWEDDHTEPRRRDQNQAFEDVGLRIAVLPAPE